MHAKGTNQVKKIRSGQRLCGNFMCTKGRKAQDTKIECVRNILDLQYYYCTCTLAKIIETNARTWHRHVDLSSMHAPMFGLRASIFLARVVVLLMHPVMMTENQFHCTRLYMYTCCPLVQSEDHMKFVSTGTFFSKTHWETSHQRPQTQQQHKTQHSLTFSKSFNMSRSHCSNSPIRLGDCTRRSTGRGGGPLSDREKGSLKETK